MFLGENLITWLVLALGGALAVGNVMALVRPPEKKSAEEDLDRAPVVRTVLMAVVGAVAALWALASLISA